VKRDWPIRTIGEVCDLVNGGTPKTEISKYWDGTNRWITPAEMGKRKSPYVDKTARTLTDIGLSESSARLLPPYSVILSSRAPIGHLAINTQPMATNQGCKGLIPRNTLQHKFLYYFLCSVVDLLNSLGTGTTFRELSGGKLKEVELPVPPLAEQERIVAVLDEAFDGIASAKDTAEQNLRNASALFESHLTDALDSQGKNCPFRQLDSLLVAGRKISYGIVKPGAHDPLGVRLIKSQQVRNNSMDLTEDFRITRKLDEEYARTRLQGGEILLNLVGASIGRSVIAPAELKDANVSRAIAVIPVTHEIAPWVQYSLRCSVGQSMIKARIGGAAQPVLNLREVKSMLIPFPPLNEQQAIVRKLDSLVEETRRLAQLYKLKLALLAALKKSLLHRAFSGQL
jgi:type I restriction enzyme, S subunit